MVRILSLFWGDDLKIVVELNPIFWNIADVILSPDVKPKPWAVLCNLATLFWSSGSSLLPTGLKVFWYNSGRCLYQFVILSRILDNASVVHDLLASVGMSPGMPNFVARSGPTPWGKSKLPWELSNGAPMVLKEVSHKFPIIDS